MPKNENDILALECTPLNERLVLNTTYDVIKNAAEKYGKKPAIIFIPNANDFEKSITISYQNLLDRVNQATNLFSSLQKTNGNVVSYLLPNLPETHFVLWGAQAVGVVNPLRPDLSPEQIVTLLKKSNSKTLVTVGEFIPGPMWKNVLKARELYPELKTIFVIGGSANEARGIYDFNTALDEHSPYFMQKDTASDRVCAYFHTSATTTPNPKLTRLTQRNQIYAAWAMGTYCGYQESDVIAVGLPMFHVGAPSVGALIPFMCGATTVMMSPMGWMGPSVVDHFWKITQYYKVTMMAALNFTYSQLLPGIKNNTTLRLAISGTALSPEESTHYKKHGIQVAELYGSSEAIIISCNSPENPHFGSMGTRFPYEQMKVMKSDGAECAPNEIGELWISGPNVTQGYQQGSQQAFTSDGWFKTGDLVRRNENGVFYFFDRTADVIKKSGTMISSLMLEHIFESHPKVARAAVIGQPDAQHSEVPVLYVTQKSECELTISDLQQWAHEKVDASISPVQFFIEPAFPLNGIAKVVKPILREKNVTQLYSNVLDKLLDGKVVFDVKTNYSSDDRLIVEIHLGIHEDQLPQLMSDIQKAFTGYSVSIAIQHKEPVIT